MIDTAKITADASFALYSVDAAGRRAIITHNVEVLQPGGLGVTERRTVMDLRRSEWTALRAGTTVMISEGPDAGLWIVDAVAADDGEVVRVAVRR